MTLAHELAERAHRIRYEDLTPTVLEWTRTAFVDTVAVTLAGINTDTAQNSAARRGDRRRGRAVPGVRHRQADRRAGCQLINGIASHALDYDDVSGAMGGHPSVCWCRRCSRWPRSSVRRARRRVGLCGRDSRPSAASRAACISIITTRDGTRRRRWASSARSPAAARLLGFTSSTDRDGDRAGGVVRLRAQGEFRHDDEAAACRALRAQRVAGGAAGARRVHRQSGRAGAQAGVPGGVQRCREPTTSTRMLDGWDAPFMMRGAGEPGLKPYPCCGSTHAAIDRMSDLARRYRPAADAIARSR